MWQIKSDAKIKTKQIDLVWQLWQRRQRLGEKTTHTEVKTCKQLLNNITKMDNDYEDTKKNILTKTE